MPSHSLDGRTWYSVQEASVYAGVSKRTIYNWLKKGMETRITPGGTLRILAEDLLRQKAPDTSSNCTAQP